MIKTDKCGIHFCIFNNMATCGVNQPPDLLCISDEERRRNRKTMAMSEVTGSRHAECQQTEHDLLGGKEKPFDRRHNLEMKMDHTRNSTDIVPKGQKHDQCSKGYLSSSSKQFTVTFLQLQKLLKRLDGCLLMATNTRCTRKLYAWQRQSVCLWNTLPDRVTRIQLVFWC